MNKKYNYIAVGIAITMTSLLNAIIVTPSNEAEYHQLLQKPAVIVDFYADWCGPCKQISRHLEALDRNNPQLTIVKVNVEKYQNLIEKYKIRQLPTLYFFSYGKQLPVNNAQKKTPCLVGLHSQKDLERIINSIYS